VSFSFGATVAKGTQVRQAIDDRRKHLIGQIPKDLDGDQADARRAELEDLAGAAAKGLEAAVKALPGASAYHLSVSGHRDTDGNSSLSLSVSAART
jgi:hypothetical protein